MPASSGGWDRARPSLVQTNPFNCRSNKNSTVDSGNSRVNLAVRVVRAAIHKTNNKQSAYAKASTFAKATVDKSAR